MLVSSQAAMSAVGLESLDDAVLVMEEGGGANTRRHLRCRRLHSRVPEKMYPVLRFRGNKRLIPRRKLQWRRRRGAPRRPASVGDASDGDLHTGEVDAPPFLTLRLVEYACES